MNLPDDTFILLSYINTLLRDQYGTLDDLCRGEDIDKDALVAKLHNAGFDYMAQINQFR